MKLAALLLLAGCASAAPSTSDTQLASRFEHAKSVQFCPVEWNGVGQRLAVDCVDNEGLVWSSCAWNACGINPECRARSQEVVMRGSCGGPDWPACRGGAK